jgi:DNA-directed RNA polymerase specialized sigma24 family protein
VYSQQHLSAIALSNGVPHFLAPLGRGNHASFATTQWELVLCASQAPSPQATEALENLCRAYWYPVYAFVRRKGYDAHQAQDLTQEFFARIAQKNSLSGAQRERGKFRSYLLGALQHFLSDQRDRANAAKRGGGKELVSLDDEAALALFALEQRSDLSPENHFEKRWAITILERAFTRVGLEFEKSGRGALFEQLKSFLAEPSDPGEYKHIAGKIGMRPSTLAVAVHRLRQRYRELVREEVAATIVAPEEVEDELRHLLATLAK